MRYVVTSVRESGTITYYCPTEDSANEKAEDFRHAEYREVRIFSDGPAAQTADRISAGCVDGSAELLEA